MMTFPINNVRVPHALGLRRGSYNLVHHRRSGGRRLACFAAIAAVVLASTVFASAEAPLDQARHRIQTSDYRATGRLVQVNGPARTTYRFSTRGHWFPDGLHVIYEIALPAGQSERLLYHLHPDGRLELTVLQPGGKAPAYFTPDQQGESLLGTGLAYEDLVEAQFFWPSQAPGAPATAGGRPCTQLKSTPTTQQSRRYSAVFSCVDPATGLPLLTSKTTRIGKQEQFTVSGVRDSGGMAVATQIKAQTAGDSTSTLILIDHGSAKAHLSAADFDITKASAGKEPE